MGRPGGQRRWGPGPWAGAEVRLEAYCRHPRAPPSKHWPRGVCSGPGSALGQASGRIPGWSPGGDARGGWASACTAVGKRWGEKAPPVVGMGGPGPQFWGGGWDGVDRHETRSLRRAESHLAGGLGQAHFRWPQFTLRGGRVGNAGTPGLWTAHHLPLSRGGDLVLGHSRGRTVGPRGLRGPGGPLADVGVVGQGGGPAGGSGGDPVEAQALRSPPSLPLA